MFVVWTIPVCGATPTAPAHRAPNNATRRHTADKRAGPQSNCSAYVMVNLQARAEDGLLGGVTQVQAWRRMACTLINRNMRRRHGKFQTGLERLELLLLVVDWYPRRRVPTRAKLAPVRGRRRLRRVSPHAPFCHGSIARSLRRAFALSIRLHR
jgi:hypothetical protein